MNITKLNPVLSVLVIALLVTSLVPAATAQANGSLAPFPLKAPAAIYGDSLASGWQDWSWDATRSLRTTSPIQSGSRSISATITKAWGALYLHGDSALSTAGYTHLEFYIHGGTSGSQRLRLVANQNTGKTYAVPVARNKWTKVSIPLADLGSPAAITDLFWQDTAGKAQPKFYIDSLALVDLTPAPTVPPQLSATPTKTFLPTITTSPTPPPPSPTAVPPGSADKLIYSDSLAAGWNNWSWSTTVNPSNSAPVQSGSASVAVTYTGGWAGFYLHTDQALSTTGYDTLTFWVNGGSAGGQKLLFAINKNNNSGVNLTLQANTWKRVDVALSSAGNPGSINDLWWHDTTGNSQATFYVDQVALVKSGGTSPQPTSQPTAQPTPGATQPPPGGTKYFSMLPPGSSLPSDAECAAMVKRKAENKGVNKTANATRGSQSLPTNYFGSAVDPRANTQIAPRVTGNFVGTTDEILQWAACKWGFDEDIVRAEAAIESWWRMDTKGDWTTNPSNCAPGHEIGADGTPGQCPESFGILQVRYPIRRATWPSIYNSTAFNADLAYAELRACYEGYEWWLNDVERGWDYGAGDEWGCMGRWFSGRWHTPAAEEYIGKVRNYLDTRIWESQNFQQP